MRASTLKDLLGGKFIGLTAGGAETYLKNKDQIDFTQSAFVLENLIGQLLANFDEGLGLRRSLRTIQSGLRGAPEKPNEHPINSGDPKTGVPIAL